MSVADDIKAAAEKVKAEGKSKPRVGRHPVNQPMVEHWTDAIGDKNPIYVDGGGARRRPSRSRRSSGDDSGLDDVRA